MGLLAVEEAMRQAQSSARWRGSPSGMIKRAANQPETERGAPTTERAAERCGPTVTGLLWVFFYVSQKTWMFRLSEAQFPPSLNWEKSYRPHQSGGRVRIKIE